MKLAIYRFFDAKLMRAICKKNIKIGSIVADLGLFEDIHSQIGLYGPFRQFCTA